MKKFNFLRSIAAALMIAVIAVPAIALDLSEARTKSLVGEKNDGYIEALKPSTEVNMLVSDINNRRKAEYTRISKENGQPVSVVGKLAAVEIAKKLPSGSMYQNNAGSWVRK